MTCHTGSPASHTTSILSTRPFTIALAGQPNMGKSTLFNLLTGLNQHVGNWPGKTVEHREGFFQYNGREFHLVDLPGTYSLTANSPEEVIAREYILREKPDMVVAVVSAANLERSLYLVSELICLPAPLIVALNMMDVAEQEGIHRGAGRIAGCIRGSRDPNDGHTGGGIRDLLREMEHALTGAVQLPPAPS